MRNWPKLWFAFDRIIFDAVFIFLALILAYFLRMEWFLVLGMGAPFTLTPLAVYQGFALKITILVIMVLGINGRYDLERKQGFWTLFWESFWSFSAGFAIVTVGFFFLKFHFFSRFIFGAAWALGVIGILISQWVVQLIRQRLYRKNIGKKSVILLGSGILADKVHTYIDAAPEYEIVHTLTEKQLRSYAKSLRTMTPDVVFLASENLGKHSVGDLAHIAHTYHAQFRLIPDESALDLASVDIATFHDLPILTLRATTIKGWSSIIKTGIDHLGAVVGLIILSPLFLILALRIKIENWRAPAIYKSVRVGKNGQEFNCYKFRSMVPDAEAQKEKLMKKNERKGGVLFKIKNDPRVTKVGQFLRRWSLDELPQLWNILKGDMSIVGPRPHLPEEVKKYTDKEHYLLSIKPGLTGLAQINGHSDLEFKEEMRYELFYLKNWNFWLDIRIIYRTLFVFLGGRNK